jgi:hypothetical protein
MAILETGKQLYWFLAEDGSGQADEKGTSIEGHKEGQDNKASVLWRMPDLHGHSMGT